MTCNLNYKKRTRENSEIEENKVKEEEDDGGKGIRGINVMPLYAWKSST